MCFNPKYAWFQYKWDYEKHKLTKRIHFKYDIGDTEKNMIIIPCGKCLACKISKANDWATRCVLESREHKKNCFITLSYRPKDLPKNATLVVRDLQLFFKNLRKKIYPEKIRYFACGEYGDKTLRPHYHIGLFGYYPKDAKFFKFNKNKQPLYISDEIAKAWGKGFIILGELTIESAGYIARYTQKKIYNKHDKVIAELGRHKEFIVTSRKPGIAMNYIKKDKNFEKIKQNFGIFIKQNDEVKLKNIPQRFRQYWRDIDEFEYYEESDKHLAKVKEDINKIIEKKGITEKQYTQEQKNITLERLKKLKRETF